MCEVGTLKELNVKPGDVVENTVSELQYIVEEDMTVGGPHVSRCVDIYRIISRASEPPKLWRDMTDAEKGALLLAYHNDEKCLEVWLGGEWVYCGKSTWDNDTSYRVRPEPKVETVTIHNWEVATDVLNGHRITFNLIDGKPDCASVKMEPIA